jgi:hypothetical protein
VLKRLCPRERLILESSEPELRNMPDAELFGLVGLPPYPTRQQFEALIAEVLEDLARAASGYRIAKRLFPTCGHGAAGRHTGFAMQV